MDTMHALSYDSIEFQEGRYTVKTLDTEEERQAAYRLRHKIFAEMLQWVPCSADELEVDDYDTTGVTVGLFNDQGRLLGAVRMLPSSGPFMLEREFRSFVSPEHPIRKEIDTMEITRLAVDPTVGGKGLSARLMVRLFKGMYQWCLANDIRYCYLEVEQYFLRIIRVLGFPCEAIGPVVLVPPANVSSQAALLDLDRFRLESALQRPEFLKWMTETNPVRPTNPWAIQPRLMPSAVQAVNA
jgi:acyl homoserine lactone synthase